MSETSQVPSCDRCGAALSGQAQDRLCTACLLESAILEPEFASNVPASAPPLLAFNDYEVLEEIARGGMGVVYRARQVSLNRPVAIKMILGGHLVNAAEMKRFRAEAEIAAQLQHANIVAIHEIGEYAGQPFFSMDLVEGRNLAQLVRDEPLPSRKAASYLKTIAEAVHYAHLRGVLHRDLKPSNVLIDENDQPRVTDFGLAKRLSGTQNSELTQTGQVLGSPSFIPPEQAAGQKHAIGPASDVYSLGAILYHLLTGRPPFLADSVPATLRMAAETEPIAPHLLNPTIPPDLATICLKCLEKDPLRRYDSARELAEELGRFLRDEPIQARPASSVERAQRWIRRKPALASAMALVLVVAIGSPIAALRINRERRRAEANASQATREAARSQQVSKVLKQMLFAAGPSVARGRDATVLREMLEQTADGVTSEIRDQPEVQGDIFRIIGNTYYDIGDHSRATIIYNRAVQSYRQAFSGAHTNLALALAYLGRSESFLGDVTRGHEHAGLGLKMARECGDTEVLIQCLKNYARTFKSWGMGSPEEEPYVREALELSEKQTSDPIQIAARKVDLAGISTNDAETGTLLKEAVALYRQHQPSSERVLVDALFSLGQHLVGTGQFEEAERTLREAVEGFHKIYDADHPYQPIVLRFLAASLLAQGKDDEAESLVSEQLNRTPTNSAYLDLRSKVLVFRHSLPPDAARRGLFQKDILSLGVESSLAQMDNLAEAESLCRKMIEERKRTLGDGHLDTSNARWCLASLLCRQSKRDEAAAVCREMARKWPEAAGHFYARGGLFQEAAVAFRGKMESAPNQFENYRCLAPILLINGDIEGYRNICQQLVNRFGATVDPVEADGIVRVGLMRSDSGVDLKFAAGLADTALERGKQHEYRPWFELAKALAEYRQERFASAIIWAQNALRSPGQLERDASANLVLAMAQWQAKLHEAARAVLGQGAEIVNKNLPQLDGGDNLNWADVIGAQILLREARALIEGDATDSSKAEK